MAPPNFFPILKKRLKNSSSRRLELERLESRDLLATFVVSNTADAGSGSLREAVQLANSQPGVDTIEFDARIFDSTIQLTSGDLIVTEGLSVLGPGADRLTIDATGSSRHFRVSIATVGDMDFSGITLTGGYSYGAGGAIASLLRPAYTMTLSDVVLTGNRTNGLNAQGGAVYNLGVLEMNDCVVTGNSTQGVNSLGGAISGKYEITIRDCQITSNETTGQNSAGGAIGADTAEIRVFDSLIHGNETQALSAAGGGIYTTAGLHVERSTISDNATNYIDAPGGGAYAGSLSVLDSTISGNETREGASQGGGVFSNGYTTIQQSTVSGNRTLGVSSSGGGLWSADVTLLKAATITENSIQFTNTGGGVFVASGGTTLENSIIADNFSTVGNQDLLSVDGVMSDFSLIGSNTYTNLTEAPVGMPDSNGNLVGDVFGFGVIDPLLGPLQNNGGQTSTHRLLPGSPAVNAGFEVPFETDQRGGPFTRVANGQTDMGAYEVQTGPGHFGDQIYDCADIDSIVAQIASGTFDPTFDFSGDGLLNIADVEAWLAEAGAAQLPSGNAYLFGDANLDGAVDGQDFIVWNNNKFTLNAAWCAGDFDANGVVDGADFVAWNNNKFQSADRGSVSPIPDRPLAVVNELGKVETARLPMAPPPAVSAIATWQSTIHQRQESQDTEESQLKSFELAATIFADFETR